MRFDHLLTSGYTFSENEYNTKQNYILFNSMILFNMALLMIAIVLRLLEHNLFLAIFDFVYLLISLAIFVLMRISRSYFAVAFYVLVFMSFVLITAIFYAEMRGIGGIGWYFILLMVVTFIRGYREGMIFFMVALATIIAASINREYTLITIATGVMPFVVAYFFIAFYENRNKEIHQIIETQRNLYAYQAKHDRLTGIPNREFFFGFFEDLLKQVSASGETVTILFIDLDNFKKVNDTYGHQAGDKVLIETAKRLKSQLGAKDMLARLGGDEFAVIVRDTQDTEALIQNLQSIMKEPIVIEKEDVDLTVVVGLDLFGDSKEHGFELYVSFSLGSATFPDDGRTETELMARADRVMYRRKKRNRIAKI